MMPPPAGDAAAFNEWTRTIDRWRGEVSVEIGEAKRRIGGIGKRVDALDLRVSGEIKAVDDRVDGVKEQLAVVNTKVAFYAAIGSVAGGGIVTLIVAVGSKALGG